VYDNDEDLQNRPSSDPARGIDENSDHLSASSALRSRPFISWLDNTSISMEGYLAGPENVSMKEVVNAGLAALRKAEMKDSQPWEYVEGFSLV
jgi:hypothetical protein